MERLNKYIARSGVASRRKADELIQEGRVKINGIVVKELGTKVTGNDVVTVDGKTLSVQDKIYVIMNKPRGVISSVSDEVGRTTVIDILPAELKKYRLFPIGRLDYDTKGVLLLTNDGEFMNALVGPNSNLEKEYLVRVTGIMGRTDTYKLANGVNIGDYVTRKCKAFLEDVDSVNKSSLVRITIKEGHYHQVKLMFEKVGFPVKRLTRVKFGELTTEGIPEGGVRFLTPHEVKRLIAMSK